CPRTPGLSEMITQLRRAVVTHCLLRDAVSIQRILQQTDPTARRRDRGGVKAPGPRGTDRPLLSPCPESSGDCRDVALDGPENLPLVLADLVDLPAGALAPRNLRDIGLGCFARPEDRARAQSTDVPVGEQITGSGIV